MMGAIDVERVERIETVLQLNVRTDAVHSGQTWHSPDERMTTRRILAGTWWPTLYSRVQSLLPEGFCAHGQILNLLEGEWGHPGRGRRSLSPCDATPLCTFPMVDLETARRAVRFAAAEHMCWTRVDLDERCQRTATCVAELRQHRELLASLLVWEIGKPYQQALVSVDRCLGGVEWYIAEIETMLAQRRPLGVISNIASWNYPLSVLVHAMLVQALAGNAVIAKTPSDGGLCALTLALGIARRCGLPVSLVSGSGGQL